MYKDERKGAGGCCKGTRSSRTNMRPTQPILVRTYHGCVFGIIWMQVTRDGMPQLVSTVPLRAGTAAHVFILVPCLFSSIERHAFFCSLLCDRELDFGERSC